MDDGAKGEAVFPGGGHVGDVDVGVTPSALLGPTQQTPNLLHAFALRLKSRHRCWAQSMSSGEDIIRDGASISNSALIANDPSFCFILFVFFCRR